MKKSTNNLLSAMAIVALLSIPVICSCSNAPPRVRWYSLCILISDSAIVAWAEFPTVDEVLTDGEKELYE